MREIKFRAWDKNVVPHKILNPVTIQELAEACMLDVKEKWPQIELMQFTGLLDKNGKEIYEGDIVKYEYERQLKSSPMDLKLVKWRQDINGTGFNITKPKQRGGGEAINHWKIIGNIHENPELLIKE